MRKVLAITTFITLALVVLPSAFVIAQSGRVASTVVTCTRPGDGVATLANSNLECPADTEAVTTSFQTYPQDGISTYIKVICQFQQKNEFSDNQPTQYEWHMAKKGARLDRSGTKFTCEDIDLNKPVSSGGVTVTVVDRGAYFVGDAKLSYVSLDSAGVTTMGPTITPVKPGDPKDPNNPGNPVTPGNPKTPYTPTQGSQECEAGFDKVGPLCIPDNPITDPNSIANSGTVGELATNIIQILLYAADRKSVV